MDSLESGIVTAYFAKEHAERLVETTSEQYKKVVVHALDFGDKSVDDIATLTGQEHRYIALLYNREKCKAGECVRENCSDPKHFFNNRKESEWQ